jgi:parallel beta-helix repeat protein
MSQNRPTLVEPLEGRTLFSVLLVDDDKQQFANASYTTLASAIKAAKAGDTIRVAAGTYRQGVNIPAGKDNLTIISDQTRKAVIDPPDGAQAAFYVKAKNVSIRRFTINGLKTSYGVLLNGDVSATVADCRIKSVRNNPLDGVQTGFGVAVFKGTATITNNVIDDYQKGGVYVDGGYSKATVTGNRIIGVGLTPAIAQNGIVFNRNASGTISNNNVSDNLFDGDTATSAGISLYKARNMTISGNTVSDNDANIVVDFSNGTKVLNNQAFEALFDGLSITRTTGALVRGNNFSDNLFDGIFADRSTGNTFEQNTLADNDEFDANDTSTGTGTGGTGNTWTNNTIGTKNKPGIA